MALRAACRSRYACSDRSIPMVAYSFQARFVAPIEAGTKWHTIRAVGKRRHARAGDELQLYTGMRTRQCRLVGRATCASVTPIRIQPLTGGGLVQFGGKSFATLPDLDDFARRDGFDEWTDMCRFWAKHHRGVVVFRGIIIDWIGFAPAVAIECAA